MKDIAVIGAGYVGLTTAACFAKMGHHVVLSEIDPTKAGLVRSGISPIFEAGLSELLSEVVFSGHLSVTEDNVEAVSNSDLVFICLPTPQDVDGSANTDVVFDVIGSIPQHLLQGQF